MSDRATTLGVARKRFRAMKFNVEHNHFIAPLARDCARYAPSNLAERNIITNYYNIIYHMYFYCTLVFYNVLSLSLSLSRSLFWARTPEFKNKSLNKQQRNYILLLLFSVRRVFIFYFLFFLLDRFIFTALFLAVGATTTTTTTGQNMESLLYYSIAKRKRGKKNDKQVERRFYYFLSYNDRNFSSFPMQIK